MGNTLETQGARLHGQLRVVLGAATPEMRSGLFVATSAPDLRIIATASTMAELVTYTRSFQPDAVIVADDMASATDLAAKISALKETLHHGRIFVIGRSAAAIAEAAGVTPVAEGRDVVGALLDLCVVGDPPETTRPA